MSRPEKREAAELAVCHPTPEQIQAAMPAMRRFLINRVVNELRPSWSGLSDLLVVSYTEQLYPGGVEQFIADQEGRRG